MKNGPRVLVLGLALALAGPAILPPEASAQDAANDVGKRRVRTKEDPHYPPLAKQLHLAGTAKVEAMIAADGHVIDTKIIGGHPLLASAAADALKKWRFEPGSRDTTETFEFVFSGQD